MTKESLRNEHGAEYWSARDLQPLLGYGQWRRFEDAIKRAVTSCKQSGNEPGHHFANAGKPITGGKGAVQIAQDYHLSRFACYLIAQNGDPRKPEIAYAQKYFAIQARRQELSDTLAADVERLELRKQTSEEFKALSGAAREAGVQDRMFGVFHDAGYKGLYGGLGREAIKERKDIPQKDQLMDRMDTTELAANQFRMTQTRDKLARAAGVPRLVWVGRGKRRRADAGKAIGRSGDGGIDGIIKEDRLGLDVVYIQAKRWDNNSVGRPDVMQFAGALQAQKANKGIFITTSRFTDDARSYVSQIGSKIVLIDGEQLTNLMIENDVGVSTVSLYPVKKIDIDYFDESI